MTIDIDTEVDNIAARKKGITFAATATDAPKVKPTLTPVGVEKSKAPLTLRNDTPFPYDDPQTVQNALRAALRALAEVQQHIDHVGKGVITLARLYGLDEDVAPEFDLAADKALAQSVGPSASPRMRTAAIAAAERVEPFTDRMSRLSAEAQAAAFKGDLVPAAKEVFGDDLLPTPTGETWQCPTHGRGNLKEMTARRSKRTYLSCTVTGCGLFEKG